MSQKKRNNKKNKNYQEVSEDDDSDYDINSESEETSDEEMEDEVPPQDGQGWPDSLIGFFPDESTQEYKERTNALFTLYKDFSNGLRTSHTLTKGELIKMADISAHMLRKPKTKKKMDWLSEKIFSLVQKGKKRQKKTSSIDVVSPTPSIDLGLSQSQSSSQSVSIIPPPSQPLKTGNKREAAAAIASSTTVASTTSPSPLKKPKAFFTTDKSDGTVTAINGFPISSHPDQFRKKRAGEPNDVQVLQPFQIDDDTHM